MTASKLLWWRDDDAIEDGPELRRIIELSARWDVPLALAVIPALAKSSLVEIGQEPKIDFLVHGFAHENHAPNGERKAEFTSGMDLGGLRRMLSDGHTRLKRLVPKALPVFVPPWNRFPSEHLRELEAAAYSGFSAWGSETGWRYNGGIRIANTHLDLIDWKGGASPKPIERLLSEFHNLCWATDRAANAPIGILTHHKQMPGEAFGHLEEFFRYVARQPDFVWTSARSIFRRAE